ncbi:acyl-CoA thioesterase [Maridesulfovibrio hydrothermalis]|uniref:Thioesterase superfamily protein n=1 Tax=Maridesulfovibrio hydrothermalis AM13 = DSM 14728 TaxID=1121451 RepID=L0RDM3_9BACT|nr:thioesterase family protein [Maridesulfovibrio hydrothermalis]CCO24849.1 Thioesterase superfamily protein [Maridesulfovibrio hydrothermalis AM13 = DSM 14728]
MNKTKDFPTPDAWMNHSVSYGETDAMGVVYYAEYLHFFERSRSLYIRERGMSYAEVEQRGIYLPVREASCRYRVPAQYDDMLNIHVGISEWKRASIKFIYDIYKDDRSILVASGFTEHACVNKDGRPVRVPEWLREIF